MAENTKCSNVCNLVIFLYAHNIITHTACRLSLIPAYHPCCLSFKTLVTHTICHSLVTKAICHLHLLLFIPLVTHVDCHSYHSLIPDVGKHLSTNKHTQQTTYKMGACCTFLPVGFGNQNAKLSAFINSLCSR